MKTNKKVTKTFDARQKDYFVTCDRLNRNKHGSKGFRKPGSRNPKKNGA